MNRTVCDFCGADATHTLIVLPPGDITPLHSGTEWLQSMVDVCTDHGGKGAGDAVHAKRVAAGIRKAAADARQAERNKP